MGRNRLGAAVAIVAVTLALHPLPASAEPVPWSGAVGLTVSAASYSTNESLPTFETSVSPALSGGYYLSVYNDLGQRVCYRDYGVCSGSLNAPLNSTRFYTAYVSLGVPPVHSPPTNDVRAVSSAVTVTNLGYVNSSITLTTSAASYSTNESLPTYQASVSPSLSGGYYLSLYNDLGQRMSYVQSGGISGSLTAPLNGSRSYTAYVSYGLPPSVSPPTNDVRAQSNTVTVTNLGWTGHFTSAEATVRDEAFLGATSARFEWDQPLVYVRVDIVDSQGGVIGSCSDGGTLDCSAALALGPDESEMVHAEARAPLPGGGYVTVATSATVELTGMDATGFAEFVLFAPPASLPPLLGAARAQQALQIRPAVQSETFCVALGTRYPSTAMFHSTVPDATLLCISGATAVMSFLIATVGVDLALDIMSDAADTDTELGAPSYDPEVAGTIFDDPDCHFYDFSGNCLEYPQLEPEPDLEALADGARIPPPPNCLSDTARDALIASMSVQNHHIITRYANQAPEGADDVLLEREANVDALQAVVADYGLNINADWNILSIPHAGPHPSGYHAWVRLQADAIDQAAGGDATRFLNLWEILIRRVIAADPSIVRKAYWDCSG